MNTLTLIAAVIIAALIPATAFSQTATAPPNFADVDAGTSDNPYQVASLENLYWMAAPGTVDGLSAADRLNKYYIQTAHIDASPTQEWFSGAGWNRPGTFTGSYDGAGYRIDGLWINWPGDSYFGLFGFTQGATLINIGLTNVTLYASSYSGPLAGASVISVIEGCYATGNSFPSGAYNGGLVGLSQGSVITNSYSLVNVTSSTSYSAGLIGSHNEYEPLLEGPITYGSLSNSYSTGSITATVLGGLVAGGGFGDNVTLNSFWDVLTSGKSTSAGGIGKTTSQMMDIATFLNAGWDISYPEAKTATTWLITDPATGYISYPYLSVSILDEVPGLMEAPAYNATQDKYYLSVQHAVDDADPDDRIEFKGVADALNASGSGVLLAPGSSPGCVNFLGNYTLDNTNTLEIEIDGLTPCTQYDQISVDGIATLGDANLVILLGFAPTIGDTFTIIDSDNPISGTFAQGSLVTATFDTDLYTFSITYSGNQVTLEVIPTEVAAVPLSGLALLLSLLLIGVFIMVSQMRNTNRGASI